MVRYGASISNHTIVHPRAYMRVKGFLKQHLKIMLQYTSAHLNADDALSVLMRGSGTATIVEEFRCQLESYWLNEWPFNIPVTNNDPYMWWKSLCAHPHAWVLSVGLSR